MVDHPTRAAEYRERAAAETAAGAATSLDQVRVKHERAARVWTDLAEAEESRAAERAIRHAAASARADAEAEAE